MNQHHPAVRPQLSGSGRTSLSRDDVLIAASSSSDSLGSKAVIKMGLGVLQDRVMEHVPGTTRYFDDPSRPQVAAGETALKTTKGPVPIILVPQPSDDPNDPLNWPIMKRDLILVILSMTSIFATALGPILAANTLTLSLHYQTPFTQIALLTGYFLLGVGVAGIFFVPTARIFGKRHLFILGTILLTISSAWAGASSGSYRSLLWARIIQGVGTAPFEALVNASVGDMYFVHERGIRMAMTNLAVFGGAFFTPILVGKITHTIGWEWSFYFEAIFCGMMIPMVFFFVPETAFRRSAHLNTDMASTDDLHLVEKTSENIHEARPIGSEHTSASHDIDSSHAENGTRTTDPSKAQIELEPLGTATGTEYEKITYRQSLLPFSGRKSDENFLKLLLRPFPLFFQPAIFWACLIQGAMIGWTVFIGIILAAIFLGPPLFWDEVKTGYAYTGAFLGAVLGFVVAGGLSDWSAKILTRRNGGIYEPEFRLVLVIPQLVFGCTGLYGFGIVSATMVNYSWFWPVFFFGLEVMGMVIGAVASSLYIVDAHRDIAIEGFTCLIIFKNFFSFGLTFSAYDWVVYGGIFNVFMAIASIQVLICLLSIPMYVFGKRNRSFFHRHNILQMTRLA